MAATEHRPFDITAYGTSRDIYDRVYRGDDVEVQRAPHRFVEFECRECGLIYFKRTRDILVFCSRSCSNTHDKRHRPARQRAYRSTDEYKASHTTDGDKRPPEVQCLVCGGWIPVASPGGLLPLTHKLCYARGMRNKDDRKARTARWTRGKNVPG